MWWGIFLFWRLLSSAPQWELDFISRAAGHAAEHFQLHSLLYGAGIWSRWDQDLGKKLLIGWALSVSVICFNDNEDLENSFVQVNRRHSSCWNISVDLNRAFSSSFIAVMFKPFLRLYMKVQNYKQTKMWRYRVKSSNCFIFLTNQISSKRSSQVLGVTYEENISS